MFWKICGFIGWLAFVLSPAAPYVWFSALKNPTLVQAAQAFMTAVFLAHVVAIVTASHYRTRRAMLTGAGA